MKYLILSVSLFLGLNGLAQASGWNSVLEASHKEFVADFTSENGKSPSAAPVGISLVSEGGEFASTVFYGSEGKLFFYDYDCHSHGDQMACHMVGKGDAKTPAATSSKYKLNDVLAMNTEAVSIFQKKHGTSTPIGAVKYWEAKGNLYFVIRSLDKAKTENLMCHFHGGTSIDCHRERNAGPNQPVKP